MEFEIKIADNSINGIVELIQGNEVIMLDYDDVDTIIDGLLGWKKAIELRKKNARK